MINSAYRTAIVVGNPKPKSRTLTAAEYLAQKITTELDINSPDPAIDLADLGTSLLDWQDPEITRLVSDLGTADLVIFASPTYKSTYTGLLKLFLDRFTGGSGLRGLAVPLMLGAALNHALAPETTLRPVLTELGATVPGRGLFILDTRYDDPDAYHDWLTATLPVINRLLTYRTGPT